MKRKLINKKIKIKSKLSIINVTNDEILFSLNNLCDNLLYGPNLSESIEIH